jgi:hypothetical protein
MECICPTLTYDPVLLMLIQAYLDDMARLSQLLSKEAAQNPVARLLMIRALCSILQNPSNIQDVH